MKVEAIQCDASGCESIAVPVDTELPYEWLALEIYQEGNGVIEAKTLCSWECLHRFVKYHERSTVPVRRRKTLNQALTEPSSDSAMPAPAAT